MELYLFTAFIVLMLCLSLFGLQKLLKERILYYKRIPSTEKWGKILYFGGSSRRSGMSYLKLSDGRIFSFWGSVLSFSSAFKFRQKLWWGGVSGTYKPFKTPAELKINDLVYQFNMEKNQRTFNFNGSIYAIPINPSGNQITFNYNWQINNNLFADCVNKNGEIFATIDRVTDNYTEVLFKNSQVSPEELFLISILVMSEKLM